MVRLGMQVSGFSHVALFYATLCFYFNALFRFPLFALFSFYYAAFCLILIFALFLAVFLPRFNPNCAVWELSQCVRTTKNYAHVCVCKCMYVYVCVAIN